MCMHALFNLRVTCEKRRFVNDAYHKISENLQKIRDFGNHPEVARGGIFERVSEKVYVTSLAFV